MENDPANNASYNALQATLTRRFNHGFSVNLSNPNAVLTSPLYGKISGSANARIIQFAPKYNF